MGNKLQNTIANYKIHLFGLSVRDKLLIISTYLFGLPALYLVLTDNNKAGYVNQQARKALVLWLAFFAVFFALRLFDNFLWGVGIQVPSLLIERLVMIIIIGYAVFRAYQAVRQK